LTFTIEVLDVYQNRLTANYSLSVAVNENADMKIFPEIIVGAQLNATYGYFLNAYEGLTYFCADAVPENVDMALFYSANTNVLYFISPSHANISSIVELSPCISAWDTKKTTFMKKIELTQAEFNSVSTAAEIEALCTPIGTASRLAGSDNVAIGTVVAIQTEEGKYGLIYTHSVAGPKTGNAKITIKIQK
jgi:hypothetical protein